MEVTPGPSDGSEVLPRGLRDKDRYRRSPEMSDFEPMTRCVVEWTEGGIGRQGPGRGPSYGDSSPPERRR